MGGTHFWKGEKNQNASKGIGIYVMRAWDMVLTCTSFNSSKIVCVALKFGVGVEGASA